MVAITQNKISAGIVINHVDRSFHVLIVTTGDISMIPSFEIVSYMRLNCYTVILLEFMLNQTTEIHYEWN